MPLDGPQRWELFMWWSVIVAAASLWAFTKAPSVRELDFREVLSIVAIGLLVAIWCRRSASLLPILRTTEFAPIWSDYFIHGTQIAQFSSPLAVANSSFLLVNQPIVFYHYAAYMLPAAVASVLDLPPLGLAASALLPYGIFLASLGSYAFARAVTGETMALLAPLALLLVPDASKYGFRNGFFWIPLAALHGPRKRLRDRGRLHRARACGYVAVPQVLRVPLAWPARNDSPIRVPGAFFSGVRSSPCDDDALGDGLYPAPCARGRFRATHLAHCRRSICCECTSRSKDLATFFRLSDVLGNCPYGATADGI